MKNYDYYVIEMMGRYKDFYSLQTVVALYENEFFHWVDSDRIHCSLLVNKVNILRKIEGIYNDD